MIIGLTGTIGAGKGTVVDYLVREKVYAHFSARQFIVEEIERRHLPVNRDTMTEVANDLRADFGGAYIIEQLMVRAQASGKDAVIESIRTTGEVESLRKNPNFKLWAVDAPSRVRFERNRARKSETDNVTYEKFLADEKRESTSHDPAKQNLPACIALADLVLINEGTIRDLEEKVKKVLEG
jgi:dephospho-CoA kinase